MRVHCGRCGTLTSASKSETSAYTRARTCLDHAECDARLHARSNAFAWNVVRDGDDCWWWVGILMPNGYGRLAGCYAHRIAYELHVGRIPADFTVDHLCRNRRCVNPDHLEAVSKRDNTLRGIGAPAINAAKTHCIHGHEFNAANTKVKQSGARDCRECDRARKRKGPRRSVAVA